MTVLEDINQYCKVNSDEFDTVPNSFNCSEIRDYDTGEFKGVDITGYWDVTEMDPYGMADLLDEEPKEDDVTRREQFVLPKSEPLYNTIYNKTSELCSNISLSEGTINSISFGDTEEDMDKLEEMICREYPFYTANEAKYSSISLIHVCRDITTDVDNPIRSLVKEELSQLDPDILDEQIVEIECSFEDFAECDLLGIRGHVVTPYPHRYYSDVESVEEYVSVVADSDEEYDELIAQDNYHVFYRLDELDGEEGHFEYEKSLINPIMNELMNSIILMDGDYKVEAESITIKNYNGYQEHNTDDKSFTGYDAEDNKETISFFFRQPFDSIN